MLKVHKVGQKRLVRNLYQGAGIGKEVSEEAKELKGEEEKKEFGQTVRERAGEKSRIREHKRFKKQQKIQKQTKPKADAGNATSK